MNLLPIETYWLGGVSYRIVLDTREKELQRELNADRPGDLTRSPQARGGRAFMKRPFMTNSSGD